MKLNIPEKYRDNIQFYLMGKENKMLITFDKKAYIVDISDLKQQRIINRIRNSEL